MFAVKVEQFVGVVERFGGQNRDDPERNVVLVQRVNAAQHAVERALSPAGAAVPVVKERRAVDTHPHVGLVRPEVPAPLRVNQCGVRLERLRDLPIAVLLEQFGRLLVPLHRHDERFSRVPQ